MYVCIRGCPYKCTLCVNTIIKNPWRGLGPQRSIGIIRRVHQAHHMKHVLFMDENFFGRVGRADEIIRGIADLGITWEANICVKDLLKLDDSFFLLMKKSGVLRLRMGVESALDSMLEMLNKGITGEQIIATRDRCLLFGGTRSLSFMTSLHIVFLHEICRLICPMNCRTNKKLHSTLPMNPGKKEQS